MANIDIREKSMTTTTVVDQSTTEKEKVKYNYIKYYLHLLVHFT